MRIFAIISIFLFSFAVQEASAQPDYEFIYADSTNKQDSIIDYGATRPSIPLFKTVTLKNSTDDTLWIKERFETYFILYKTSSGDDSFNEFEDRQGNIPDPPDLTFPVIVLPKDSFTIVMRFDSDVTGEQAGLGTKTAFLKLSLFKKNTDIKVASRIFFLTVLKTNDLLVAKVPEVKFGLVYINSSISKPWDVINASTENLIAEQTFTTITPESEFFVLDTLREVPAGPSKTIPLRILYAPKNLGPDTAKIQAEYKLPNMSDRDTILSLITGFGVEQKLDFVQATSENGSYIPASDTITIGNIRVGIDHKVTLEFKNNGNIYFRALADEIDSGNNSEFMIQRNFSTVPLDVGFNQTADIVLKPRQIGTQTISYSINSDIVSRVSGVPQEVLKRTVYIRFQGVEPRFASVNSVGFDSLEVLPDCQLRTTRDFVISNTGNIPLKIEPPVLQPGSGNFTFINPITQPVDIQPGGNFIFKINFTPNSTDFKTDTLIIANNSSQPIRKIVLEGKGIKPQVLSLSLPQDIRVMPGTVIRVPLIADAALLQRASTYEGMISYDETLLKPHPEFVITQNTASAGAATSFENATKMIRITSPVGFNNCDTLAILQFDTFLGKKLETNIEIAEQSVKLGVANCLSIFKSVNIQSGRVTLDSACGLAFKIGNGNGKFRFEQSIPFPANERSEIEYEVAFPTHVSITLYDSYGREVQRIVDGHQPQGIFKAALPMSGRIPGVYFCEMRAGIYSAVRQIIVAE